MRVRTVRILSRWTAAEGVVPVSGDEAERPVYHRAPIFGPPSADLVAVLKAKASPAPRKPGGWPNPALTPGSPEWYDLGALAESDRKAYAAVLAETTRVAFRSCLEDIAKEGRHGQRQRV